MTFTARSRWKRCYESISQQNNRSSLCLKNVTDEVINQQSNIEAYENAEHFAKTLSGITFEKFLSSHFRFLNSHLASIKVKFYEARRGLCRIFAHFCRMSP